MLNQVWKLLAGRLCVWCGKLDALGRHNGSGGHIFLARRLLGLGG